MAKVKYKLVFLAVLRDEYDINADIQERRTCSRLEHYVVVPQGSSAKASAYFDAKTELEKQGWSIFGFFDCELVGVVPDPEADDELIAVDIEWDDFERAPYSNREKIAV